MVQQICLDLDHDNFYCPVTGELIRNHEIYQASAATVFTFLDEVGDFQDIDPELAPLWEKVQEETDDKETWDVFEEFLKRINNESIVCFTITTNGGPFASTCRIGIDMNYCADDESTSDE